VISSSHAISDLDWNFYWLYNRGAYSNFFGRLSMGYPKITVVAYGLAVGFILIVAFYSSPKTLIAASEPAATDLK
jgi:hypothetical protein